MKHTLQGIALIAALCGCLYAIQSRAELPASPAGVSGTPALWEYYIYAFSVVDSGGVPNFVNGPLALQPQVTRVQLYATQTTCSQQVNTRRGQMASVTVHIGTGSTFAEVGWYVTECAEVQ